MLPPIANIGQALRWAAAIEEMESYFKVPAHFRSVAFREFSGFVTNCIGHRSNLGCSTSPAFVTIRTKSSPLRAFFHFCRCDTGSHAPWLKRSCFTEP